MTRKILLADDHSLLRAAVRRTLEESRRFEVVGECRSGTDLIPMVGRTGAEIVLLDLRLPGSNGLRSLERIRATYPHVKVVMLSAWSAAEHVDAAFARGASGYIVKTIEQRDLSDAVCAAVENSGGSRPVGLPAVNAERALALETGLTEREVTIVKLVARGLSNQQIALELSVTEQTVKFHLSNIYRKVGVANRTEAARWAHAQGLVEQPAFASFEPLRM